MASFGILLSDDLIFTSRITGTARALGLNIKVGRTANDARRLAGGERPACLIVDVHLTGLDLAALVAEWKADGACKIVGYGSHVAADVLHAARAAGCDIVMPRSQFVEGLAVEMPGWFDS